MESGVRQLHYQLGVILTGAVLRIGLSHPAYRHQMGLNVICNGGLPVIYSPSIVFCLIYHIAISQVRSRQALLYSSMKPAMLRLTHLWMHSPSSNPIIGPSSRSQKSSIVGMLTRIRKVLRFLWRLAESLLALNLRAQQSPQRVRHRHQVNPVAKTRTQGQYSSNLSRLSTNFIDLSIGRWRRVPTTLLRAMWRRPSRLLSPLIVKAMSAYSSCWWHSCLYKSHPKRIGHDTLFRLSGI